MPFTGLVTLGESFQLLKAEFSFLPSKGDSEDERN